MRKLVILTLSLFALSVLLSGVATAGKIVSLQPGDLQRLAEAKQKKEIADRDVKFVKGRPLSKDKGRITTVTGQDECDVTLTNRTMDDFEVNWGYVTPGDSGCIWFQAPGDLNVLAVRIRSYNWVGNLLLDIWETPYQGEYTDADVPIHLPDIGWTTPLGAHLAGPVPVTISEGDLMTWVQIDLPAPLSLSMGDNFLVGMWFQITGGWGFTGELPDGRTADLIKYYEGGRADEDPPYWWIREYHHQVDVLVELTGDTPPDFGDVTVLLTTCTAGVDRPVCADVTDINCGEGDAGVASVEVCYTVDGGAETCVPLTQDGDTWCGTIPGQPAGSEVNYYYKATDVEGLVSTTRSYTYFVWEATAPTLVVYNTSDFPSWIDFYYMYGAADACGVPYAYDWWYVPSYGPVGEDCLDLYKNIIWIGGSFPASSMPDMTGWLAAGTADHPHNLFITSQDYGCWWYGCADVTFGPGDFEYDYLGMAALAPQDVGGGGTDPYPIDAVCADEKFGYLCAAHPGQLNYYPDYELGFGNWIDNLEANADGIVCFTDPNTGNDCGVRVEGDGFNTVFLPFDVLALDWLDPYYQWTQVTENLFKAFLDQVYYCCGNQDPPKLHLYKAETCEYCVTDSIIIKPDTDHEVCVYIENICPDYDIEAIHFMLTWNGDIQFKDSYTFSCTDLDSSGWDIKEHQDANPGGGRDTMEVWLVGGGNAQEPLGEDGCILRIKFHTQAGVQPGDRDTIHFEFAEWNEGGILATNDFYKKINEPPVITWEGVDAPDTMTVTLQESHDYTFLVDAHDWDIDCNRLCGDSLILWAQSDPVTEPCPWSAGATFDTNAVRNVCGTDRYGMLGCGYVEGVFTFHPPKHDTCDNFWVDFIVASTWQTDQCLYDTLTVNFIIEDCVYQFAWNAPPPEWEDPCENYPIGYPDVPGTLDVYACQDIEIPVAMHIDSAYALDDTIWSIYLEVDYDNRLEVFEVGNEGLITEHVGVLTYRHDPDYSDTEGKIYVALAFNAPLQWPPWPDPPDTVSPFGFVVSCWYKLFYVGFHIPEELEESTNLVLTHQQCKCKVNEHEYNCCSIDEAYLHVRTFEKAGDITYSDNPSQAVDSVTVILTGTSPPAPDTVITGADGHYSFTGLLHHDTYTVTPDKVGLPPQVVNSFDAGLILRWICKSYDFSHNDSLAADVTGDGTASAFDASVILKWVVCGYCTTALIPDHNIGDWVFESVDCANVGVGPWGPGYWDVINPTADDLDNCFEAVIIGDVSQNWPGPPSVKVVADGIDAKIGAKTLTVAFAEPVSAVDMVITYEADLKVIDVSTASGLVEWMAQANELRVAAASEEVLGDITVTFERMVPTQLEISALADESIIMTTATKVIPLPAQYSLAQNYPNPFNPVTSIEYALPEAAKVKVEVYNVLGQVVEVLVNSEQEAGYHAVTWDGSNAASGVYFYRIVANEFTSTKRMVLMK